MTLLEYVQWNVQAIKFNGLIIINKLMKLDDKKIKNKLQIIKREIKNYQNNFVKPERSKCLLHVDMQIEIIRQYCNIFKSKKSQHFTNNPNIVLPDRPLWPTATQALGRCSCRTRNKTTESFMSFDSFLCSHRKKSS